MGKHKHVLHSDYSFQLLSDLSDVSFLLFCDSSQYGAEPHIPCIQWLIKWKRVVESGKSGWGLSWVCISRESSRYCRDLLQISAQSSKSGQSFTFVARCPPHFESSHFVSVDLYSCMDCGRLPILHARIQLIHAFTYYWEEKTKIIWANFYQPKQ